MRPFLVLCVIGLLAVPARGEVSARDRDEARRAFNAGQAADTRRDWKTAIEHYLRANDLVPHPFAVYNIAADYERLGKLREAAVWYERYLQQATETKDREKVARLLRDISARPGTITVRSVPDGMPVTIDGVLVGPTPYSAVIKAGAHRVTLERNGQRDDRDVNVEFGEPVSLDFGVVAATSVAPAGPGALGTIDTAPPVPESRQLGYFFGFGGGADVRGNGTLALFDLGLRYRFVDGTVRFGKTDGLSTFDFLVRLAFTNAKLAPYAGFGYGFVTDSTTDPTDRSVGGNSKGFLVVGGVRYDAFKSERVNITIVAETGIRYYSDLGSERPTLYVPLMATLQLAYNYQIRAGI